MISLLTGFAIAAYTRLTTYNYAGEEAEVADRLTDEYNAIKSGKKKPMTKAQAIELTKFVDKTPKGKAMHTAAERWGEATLYKCGND